MSGPNKITPIRGSKPHPDEQRGAQYLRVSIDASGRSRSTGEQEVDNLRDAATQGIPMVRTYLDNNRSASRYATREREDFADLLRDITRNEWDVLWLWESSRGSRKVSEWVTLLELAEAHRKLFRVTSHGRTYDPANPRDRRSLLEDAVDSEYESGKLSVRAQRAVDASAAEGRPHGMIPYGYAREYELVAGRVRLARQVIDPVTAPIVEEIVTRIAGGDPLKAIAEDLTMRGIPTPLQHRALRLGKEPPAGEWSRSTIRALLASPTMIAARVHQGQVVGEAKWEPIVGAADYAAAQRWLRSRGLQSNPGSAVKHLLSGVAECGICGAWCSRQMNNGVPSYACRGLPAQEGQPRPSRKHVTRSQLGLDAAVTSYVVARLADPDLFEQLAKARAVNERRSVTAARELGDLRARLEQFEESAATGGITAAAFGRIEAQLLEKIHAAQAQLAGFDGVPSAVLSAAGPDAARNWNQLERDVAARRVIVRALVRVIVHRATSRGSHGFDDSTIEIIKR